MATTFTPRSRVTIRDTILANWQARYRAIGLDLLITKGSDAYMQADVFALELEGIEVQAAQTRNDIFPPDASPAALARHGYTDGVTRKGPTAARFVVQGTCTTGATLDLTGKTARSTGGIVYTPEVTSVADVDSDGFYTLTVRANTAGAKGNLPIGAVLQWSQTPVGASSAALTVTSITTVGTETETDTAYAKRIMTRRRERAGSGNRSDWYDWVIAADGVESVFVIPGMLDLATSPFTPGALTIVPLGPAQGDSPTNTRIISPARLLEIKDYIEGARDKTGLVVTGGRQLRPIIIAPGNYSITSPNIALQAVAIEVKLSPGYRNEVVGIHARVASAVGYIDIAGDHSGYLAQYVRVYVGTTYYRGGYAIRKVASAVYSAGNTRLTFDTTVAAAPVNDTYGYAVYPAPSNDDEIRAAVFAYFDQLGPSAYGGIFERYPTETEAGGSVFYTSQFTDFVIPNYRDGKLVDGVEGVIAVTVSVPAVDTTVTAGYLLTLSTLCITQGA